MTEHRLMATVRGYARTSAANSLVTGYWILDDQPGTDFGSLRQIEIEIADILHHYAPSRPTICGVAAYITKGGGYSFDPALLRDVTATGCDELGIYVFGAPQTPPGVVASTTYNWSMGPLLSTIRTSLESAGLGKLPWIGIGQAWGGINRLDGTVVVAPSTEQMVEQAGAFCRAGASAMTWYGWTLTAFRDLSSPATDIRLETGVVEGGRACDAAWGLATPDVGQPAMANRAP